MKDPTPSNFAALIGIDWADKKHDMCELDMATGEQVHTVVGSSPPVIHEWAARLAERFPDKPVAVGCELTKGPLVTALLKHKHITLFTINPSTVAKYRKAFTHSGTKNDPNDARIQCEILSIHMDKLRQISPVSVDIEVLGQLIRHRRKLVQDRVKQSNRVTGLLKNYYPQVLDWFNEKDTLIFCDFLSRWPSLSRVKKHASKR